jgi:hypothetical protein
MRNTAGWACQRCKSTFLSENYRNRHIRTNACFWRRHEDDKYHCPYRGCGATFARTDTCARHVARVHAVIPSHFGEDEEEGPDGEIAEDMEEGGDSGAAASAAAAAGVSGDSVCGRDQPRREEQGRRRRRQTVARDDREEGLSMRGVSPRVPHARRSERASAGALLQVPPPRSAPGLGGRRVCVGRRRSGGGLFAPPVRPQAFSPAPQVSV